MLSSTAAYLYLTYTIVYSYPYVDEYARKYAQINITVCPTHKLILMSTCSMDKLCPQILYSVRPFRPYPLAGAAQRPREGKQTQENLYLQALGSPFINSLHSVPASYHPLLYYFILTPQVQEVSDFQNCEFPSLRKNLKKLLYSYVTCNAFYSLYKFISNLQRIRTEGPIISKSVYLLLHLYTNKCEKSCIYYC
uniref:Uncharacterized protein n=1 Tax=Glossina austeni TaxID=7395 RepID=A0A1A9V6S5_GLOAU